MLFKHRFHDGIRSGKIRLSFRIWKRAQVRAGCDYRCGPLGRIHVESVDQLAVSEITSRAARMAGFESLEAMLELLRASSERRVTPRTQVYRIRFRYLGATPAPPDPTTARVAELCDRLEGIDRRSRRAAWTMPYLEMIAEQPGVVARELAQQVGRETAAFKTEVRKLKALGLTESLEVGYRLSALGRAVLRARSKKN